LRQAKPDCIKDLIALNALFHPGLREYIPRFIDRKHGRHSVEYPDPCLEDILKETYGLIVYQEQVTQILQRITGYSLAQADLLRLILGKKNPRQTDTEEERFIIAAVKWGFKKRTINRLFSMLIDITGYTVNKSHATAYTKLSYQAAYLKANFPDEFRTAAAAD
jgi:DNA polymerase-3 subunit alpha